MYIIKSNFLVPQGCFTQSNCQGSPFSVGSADECCVGTDDGMSYSASGTICNIRQCIGILNTYFILQV